jgi:hypothetical protein
LFRRLFDYIKVLVLIILKGDQPCFRPASLALHPKLTKHHRKARVDFVQKEINSEYYYNQYNKIHINEKWFWQPKGNKQVYLAADKKVLQHVTRHKSHVLKAMFLCAIGRPWKTQRQQGEYNDAKLILDDHDDWYWDGKVGCYPIVDIHLTCCRSVNQEAGVSERYLLSMIAAVYEKFL